MDRGLAYKNLSRHDGAIADFNKATELNPNESSLFNYMGASWVELDEHSAAIDSFSRAIALNPEAEYLAARGDVYFRIEEYDNALEDYQRALRLNPSTVAFSSRGNTYLKLGEQDKALSDFRTALRIDRLRPDVHISASMIHFERGHLKRAVEQLTDGIATIPNLLEANQEQCRGIPQDQELEIYNVAVNSIADLYRVRAMCRFMNGDNQRAIEDFDAAAAINLNPRDAKSYHGRGGCLVRKNEPERAIEDLSIAIVLDAHYGEEFDSVNTYTTRGIATSEHKRLR